MLGQAGMITGPLVAGTRGGAVAAGRELLSDVAQNTFTEVTGIPYLPLDRSPSLGPSRRIELPVTRTPDWEFGNTNTRYFQADQAGGIFEIRAGSVTPSRAGVPHVSEELPELGYRNARNATRAEREAILEEFAFRERGPQPGRTAASTEIGDMFRDELATRMSRNKNVEQVLTGRDVRAFDTPWGDRIFDIEVTLKDGRTIYLETKAGGAGVDGLQQVKDNWLRETGIRSTVVRQNR
jgi:hypothetical protein